MESNPTRGAGGDGANPQPASAAPPSTGAAPAPPSRDSFPPRLDEVPADRCIREFLSGQSLGFAVAAFSLAGPFVVAHGPVEARSLGLAFGLVGALFLIHEYRRRRTALTLVPGGASTAVYRKGTLLGAAAPQDLWRDAWHPQVTFYYGLFLLPGSAVLVYFGLTHPATDADSIRKGTILFLLGFGLFWGFCSEVWKRLRTFPYRVALPGCRRGLCVHRRDAGRISSGVA